MSYTPKEFLSDMAANSGLCMISLDSVHWEKKHFEKLCLTKCVMSKNSQILCPLYLVKTCKHFRDEGNSTEIRGKAAKVLLKILDKIK
jgi:hypothetical protein